MKNYDDFKKQLLKKPVVKKAYDDLKVEYVLIEMIIEKRLEQGLTQSELAKKIGTRQPVISRLERGTYNPSIKFLHRVADALEADLKISIT
jgi:predicted transcriptional regulator